MNHLHPVTAPDQPIYRGSAVSALGQQLLDARNAGISRDPAARLRLEKTQNRNQALLEAQARRENRAAASPGLAGGIPSDGGFFLQAETAIDLIANGYNNSLLLPRCQARTLNASTQYMNFVTVDEQSRSDGMRRGGLGVYSTPELGEFDGTAAKLSESTLQPEKLTGLFPTSDEMLRNSEFVGAEIRQLFGEEFAFKCQDLIINGSGVGEALGVTNANATLIVSKESGQGAKTILTKNLSKMWAAFHGDAKNAVWLTNRNVASQLDELIVLAGAGGATP